jgi:hypothetical protein
MDADIYNKKLEQRLHSNKQAVLGHVKFNIKEIERRYKNTIASPLEDCVTVDITTGWYYNHAKVVNGNYSSIPDKNKLQSLKPGRYTLFIKHYQNNVKGVADSVIKYVRGDKRFCKESYVYHKTKYDTHFVIILEHKYT